VVVCLERGADCMHMVQLMPLLPQTPSSLPHLNPDWFCLSGTGIPKYKIQIKFCIFEMKTAYLISMSGKRGR